LRSILLRLRLCVEYFIAFEVVWSILLHLWLGVKYFIAFEVMCGVFYCV